MLAAARQRAAERAITIGGALGELARRGLEQAAAEEDEDDDFWKGVRFLPKHPGKPKVTSELVYRLLEETDLKDKDMESPTHENHRQAR